MQEMDLGGAWKLKKTGGSETLAANVPGCVHTDLLAAGKIEEPYYRDNENRLQWIGEAAWTYSREFEVSTDFILYDRILLRCEMLDTIAVVSINGRVVGRSDNMFRTWEFDAKKLLRAGRNRIDVAFSSAIPYLVKKAKGAKHKLGRSFGSVESGWIRKEPCNFGWDWGPKLVTCGIQRAIKLVGFNVARLTEIRVNQTHRSGSVTLDIRVEVDGVRGTDLVAGVSVWRKYGLKGQVAVPVKNGVGRARLNIRNPELWWPAGMGGQPMYEVTVDLVHGNGDLLDTDTKRIGLRTLRVKRQKDRWGESFTFVANGVPFFAKGADWIPADTFQSRVTPADFRRLLVDSRDANMNMLRVWGGGVYEEDCFYDICDELGLCVWQDFMFACNAYPSFDKEFMASVRAEVADNVKRLRHHPSIALWCGNNELEMLNLSDKWKPGRMSWTEYGKLFDRLIPDEVRKHDSEHDYWPSSPHSPRGNRGNVDNPNCGDAHLWAVWHGTRPFEWYRGAFHRFVSEFGFQSFTEPKTARGFTVPDDRNVTSRVMEHHQRSGSGNALIMHYMLSWFRMPLGFDNTVWMSQILQGLAIKYAVEHWRRNVPRCMGAIYWQLNDCWPVASWASIDYAGRWKALHYDAKKFFAPLMISGVEKPQTGEVDVHVSSDLMASASTSVRWTVTDVAGRKLAAGRKNVRIPARKSLKATTLSLKKELARVGAENMLVWLELVSDGETVSRNLVLFARPKHMELKEPGIVKSVKRAGDGFAVTLRTKRPALWTWLELKGVDARYSDNFVHLRPGASVKIMVHPVRAMSAAAVSRSLAVKSLIDTY